MKLDIDLQTWSEFITSISDRRTPYNQLTEVDQVGDRLALELAEDLLSRLSPKARDELLAIIHQKIKHP